MSENVQIPKVSPQEALRILEEAYAYFAPEAEVVRLNEDEAEYFEYCAAA